MSFILIYEPVVINTTAKETSLPIESGSSMDHGLPHSFRWKHRTQTYMISVDCTDHGHHYGLQGEQGQYGPWTPTCSPTVTSHTKSISMACDGSTNHRQHRPEMQHRSSPPSVSPIPWLAYSRYSIQIHWIKKQTMSQKSVIDIIYAWGYGLGKCKHLESDQYINLW